MYHSRGSRGSRRRSTRPVINSFTKRLFLADASFAAGFTQDQIALGEDSVAAGQTTATDEGVPTGAIIKFIEVQFANFNAASSNCFVNCSLQYKLSNQSFINPNLLGFNDQRAQCLHLDNFSVGIGQNATHKFKFRIPKQFQRIKKGMRWALVWSNSASVNRQTQIIYKFYR